jgi:hypothetical protein
MTVQNALCCTETLNRPNCAITGWFIEAAGVLLKGYDFLKNKNQILKGILLLLLLFCLSYSLEELHENRHILLPRPVYSFQSQCPVYLLVKLKY